MQSTSSKLPKLRKVSDTLRSLSESQEGRARVAPGPDLSCVCLRLAGAVEDVGDWDEVAVLADGHVEYRESERVIGVELAWAE